MFWKVFASEVFFFAQQILEIFSHLKCIFKEPFWTHNNICLIMQTKHSWHTCNWKNPLQTIIEFGLSNLRRNFVNHRIVFRETVILFLYFNVCGKKSINQSLFYKIFRQINDLYLLVNKLISRKLGSSNKFFVNSLVTVNALLSRKFDKKVWK